MIVQKPKLNIFTKMTALAQKHGAINLAQGFPDYDPPEELLEIVKEVLGMGKNQYAPMAGDETLRQHIARDVNNRYNLQLDSASEITITSGASEGIFSTLGAILNPGDKVHYFEPAYDLYAPAIRQFKGIPCPHTLNDKGYGIDWNKLSDEIGPESKVIIINSPHNPTGRVLGEEDMKNLIQILKEYPKVLVLSDEVYEHIIFDGIYHQSVLGYKELQNRSIAVYSFGKTFHCTGWRIGYVVAPATIMNKIRGVHQYNTFSATSFLQIALARYIEEYNRYRDLAKEYQEKRDLFKRLLAETPFEVIDSQGTYFINAKYDKISDLSDDLFANWLTEKHKVAVIPVSAFYSTPANRSIIRFCFAKRKSTLELAAQHLSAL